MRKGFTLAEVLITLGVIGVVAAATLPTLIANHEKKVWAKSLAKSYSTATQACRMALAQNNTSYINLTDFYKSMKNNHFTHNEAIYKKYFNSNARPVPVSRNSNYSGLPGAPQHLWHYAIDFPQMTMFVSAGDWHSSHSPKLRFGIDVNGLGKDPNKVGADMFAFDLNYDCSLITTNPGAGSCSGNGGSGALHGCFRKIMEDGWEMKYDPMLGTGFGGGDY